MSGVGGAETAPIAGTGFTPRRARLTPLRSMPALNRWANLAWTILLAAAGAALAQLFLLTVTASSTDIQPGDPTPPASPATTPAAALLPTLHALPRATATPTETPVPAPSSPSPTATASPQDEPVPEDPELEPYLRLLAALEAMPSDGAAEELSVLAQTWPGTAAAYEAHLALARYYGGRGDGRASANFEAALALDRPLQVRLEWATYLEATGRAVDAYAAFRDVARRFPSYSVPTMQRLSGDPIALARDFLDLGFYQEALAALPVGVAVDEIQVRAEVLTRLRRHGEALAEFERWLLLEPVSQAAQLGRAASLVSLGRLEEALAAYRSATGATATLGEAQVLSALGRREEALDRYLSLSTALGWWSAAGLLERMGRPADSLQQYSLTAASTSFLADDAAYRLWVLARAQANEEYESEARAFLEKSWPNYYTLLARGQAFTATAAPELASVDHLALRRASFLSQMGRPDWAARELVLASRSTQDPAHLLAFSQALFELGAYHASQRIAERDVLAKGATPLQAWRLSYPEAYPELVGAASAEFGLDPILIWSVMRQESRYDSQAISRANAHGLMQVVPATRDEIGRALGEPVDHESMFDPATSIRFGAFYLSQMLKRFNGDLELAVAAYNGGGGTVSRSLADPMVSSRDDFYRWLTLAEPREFLNRVMLNYRIYQWLDTL